MQINPLFKKGLVAGIVVLLSLSITPIIGSQSIEKKQLLEHNLYFDNITVTVTMGHDGWYVSNVVLTFNGDDGNHTYFRINEGPWIEYTAPVTISTDGINLFEWTSDFDHFYCKLIKIDKTPPEIVLLKEIAEIHKINFIADTYDVTSGVWRVDFYLDNQLVNSDTIFPFEWTWEGSDNHNITAIVYDNAGNSATGSKSTSFIQDQYSFYGQLKMRLFQKFFYNLLLNQN
jgi:hypothetical protein